MVKTRGRPSSQREKSPIEVKTTKNNKKRLREQEEIVRPQEQVKCLKRTTNQKIASK